MQTNAQKVPGTGVAQAAETAPETGSARNVILFVGDGMGLSTVTAARIHAGQRAGADGESHRLSFEAFPRTALVTTYNHDAQVPDSAGTATQMMGGYRARIGQINVRPEPPASDFPDPRLGWCTGDHPPTLLDRAKARGLRVGVVSTARLTHATPAALYAHSPDRSWEAPGDVPEAARAAGCTSIAEQLAASDLDVAVGGGAREFEGVDMGRFSPIGDVMPWTLPALGMPTRSHMPYAADLEATNSERIRNGRWPVWTLSEYTESAIVSLANPNGYLLVVEAGRIDHAHHDTNAFRALEDTVALSDAVRTARNMVGEDTLILVTADHGHVFTMAGYPARGNPVLGFVHGLDPDTRERADAPSLDLDGRPYTTLGYHNGSSPEGQNLEPTDPDYRQKVAVRLGSETHSGEDVPLYATGPGSDRVGGVMDQTEIADVIDAALGLDSTGR